MAANAETTCGAEGFKPRSVAVEDVGEAFRDLDAPLPQIRQLRVGRVELPRAERGEPEDLARADDRRRMPGMEAHVRLRQRAQRERGPEGELVGDDDRGPHLGEEPAKPGRHLLRPPEQIPEPRLGLVAEGLDHPLARGRQEGVDALALVARLLGRPDQARVAPRPEHQLPVAESVLLDAAAERRPRRHEDVVPAGAELAPERGEREVVGGVVRAEQERSHAATSSREESPRPR